MPTRTRSPGDRPTADRAGHLRHQVLAVGQLGVDAGDRAEEPDRGDRGGSVGVGGDGDRLGPQEGHATARGDGPFDRRDRRTQQRGGPARHLGRDPVAQPDELGHEPAGRVGVELGRGSDLLEPAGVHHADPVGDGERLLLVVGDEQRGRADLELDPPDLVAQLGAHLGVERRERLVEQQHRRLDRQRPGQRDALLLATRELAGVALAVLGEADQLELLLRDLAARAAVLAAQLEAERDVVEHGHVREEAVGLEDHPHVALVGRHAGQVLAADLDAAGRGLVEAGQDPQGGGLAAAGRPQQGDQLAGREVQGEPVERAHRCHRPGSGPSARPRGRPASRCVVILLLLRRRGPGCG